MKWFTLASALVGTSQAALRFGCSTLSVQRLDPVVQPGYAPSAHVHQIVGGNAFNATMDPSIDVGNVATCTTCTFAEDFSNYWTALMYFKARNGSYHRVPQYANAQLEGSTAGMTIYYTQESFNSNGNQKITSFKPVSLPSGAEIPTETVDIRVLTTSQGFRMTVGSASTNTREGAVHHSGLRYTCLQTVMTRGQETPDFPAKACPAGIMAIHHFPA